MQCWDADPRRRPNLGELINKIFEMRKHCRNISNDSNKEQEEFHNQPYIFSISNNVDDDILNMMQSSSIFKGSKKKLSKVPQINSNKDFQVDYYRRKTIQQTKNVDIEDEHEIYNDPNLHSEDQDELEIPWIV
ncbi:unnamed protein product [Rhizophagus irregularis]|nr:unnamed protein product [Rhizophagus irregularis]